MIVRNKKGFTLIELMAVLMILAIIALITTPVVLNVIKNAEKNSFKETADNLLKVAKQSYLNTISADATTYTYSNGVETKESGNITLSYIGNKPKDGTLMINADGDVAFAIHDGKRCATKVYNEDEVTIEDKALAECELPIDDPYAPVLVQGLIPVYYDETAMVWKKAKLNNLGKNWYDYDNFKWANAVTVTATNRATYASAAVGTTIPMSDINTMFVWIPRYKYRIPAGTGPREIDIVLETKDTSKSTGNAITEYYTHPAFTFGTTELSGIWVGKFEITGSITGVTIAPDSPSISLQTNKAFYDAIKGMNGNSIYGLSNDSDIHMIKNTEWGAATYLSYSKYGKYGNPNYVGNDKELYKNNSSGRYTGRSMGSYSGNGIKTPTYEYNGSGYFTYDGKCACIQANLPAPCNSGSVGQVITNKNLAYGASTTGTIYGIYDMSGGAWDSVMGPYMPNPIPATGLTDQSGFSTTTTNSQYESLISIDSKYYDRYLGSTLATNYIKGDATYETNGWYSDSAAFLSSGSPWLYRGGRHMDETAIAGIFGYYIHNGTFNNYRSTRAILVSNN